MDVQTKDWDVVAHLDSKEAILAYLDAAFEDGDPDLIAAALDDVAKARGLVGNERLTSDTSIAGVIRAVKALGLELTAKAPC